MRNFVEPFVFKVLLNNRESFKSDIGEHLDMRVVSSYKLIAAIISLIITQLLLLFLGKWLWNNYLVKIVSGIKPLESIGQLIAISILIKLLIN